MGTPDDMFLNDKILKIRRVSVEIQFPTCERLIGSAASTKPGFLCGLELCGGWVWMKTHLYPAKHLHSPWLLLLPIIIRVWDSCRSMFPSNPKLGLIWAGPWALEQGCSRPSFFLLVPVPGSSTEKAMANRTDLTSTSWAPCNFFLEMHFFFPCLNPGHLSSCWSVKAVSQAVSSNK